LANKFRRQFQRTGSPSSDNLPLAQMSPNAMKLLDPRSPGGALPQPRTPIERILNKMADQAANAPVSSAEQRMTELDPRSPHPPNQARTPMQQILSGEAAHPFAPSLTMPTVLLSPPAVPTRVTVTAAAASPPKDKENAFGPEKSYHSREKSDSLARDTRSPDMRQPFVKQQNVGGLSVGRMQPDRDADPKEKESAFPAPSHPSLGGQPAWKHSPLAQASKNPFVQVVSPKANSSSLLSPLAQYTPASREKLDILSQIQSKASPVAKSEKNVYRSAHRMSGTQFGQI